MPMTLPSPDYWGDNANFKDGKCAVCNTCRIHKVSGRCMYGGPFIGYLVMSDKQADDKKREEEAISKSKKDS